MSKKELIRESAVKVIANKGYYNTTMRMVAEEANIAVGTIYIYFKNKEEILNYIFITEFEKRARFLKGLSEDNRLSTGEKLTGFLDYHFAELERDKNTGKVLIQESMNPQLQNLEGVRKFLNELPQYFTALLHEGMKKGEIRNSDCRLLAAIIFHAIRGVVYEINEGNYDYGEAKKELKRFILEGITK